MSTGSSNVDEVFTLIWIIEDFCFCRRTGDVYVTASLTSSSFDIPFLRPHEWKIDVYPEGYGKNDDNQLEFCIGLKNKYKSLPSKVKVEISLLSCDGCFHFTKTHIIEPHGNICICSRDELFRQKSALLPEDTLTVQCRFYREGFIPSNNVHCKLHSRMSVDKKSFEWTIEKFSQLSSRNKGDKYLDLNNPLHMTFFCTGGGACDEYLKLRITKTREDYDGFSTCKLYLLNHKEKAVYFAFDEYKFTSELKQDVWIFSVIKTKELFAKKEVYLKDDVLKLRCEIAMSSSMSSTELVENCMNNVVFTQDEEADAASNTLKSDINSLLQDGNMSDLNIQLSNGKKIRAHKIILSARSPVFKAMFANTMKESVQGVVEISDMNENTVNRLLSFIYSDTVEDTGWEDGLDLYIAAAKYGIESLKRKCAGDIISSLSISNFGHVLNVADLHQDDRLKADIQNFILKQEGAIIRSDEWKSLEEKNPRLACETIRHLYLKKVNF